MPSLFRDSDGEPLVRRSFCAFLDVLGFRQHVKEAQIAPGGIQAMLNTYLSAVSPPTDQLLETAAAVAAWQVVAFSDSVVLGYPLQTPDAEPEFGALEDELLRYQLVLALSGFFVRGGLAIGELFMDERLAFGPALIDAYELQDTIANTPRIVLSLEMATLLRKHLGFYAFPSAAPHNQVLLVDSDERVFLNYLSATITEGEVDVDALARHRSVVEKGLKRYQSSPRIWSKYQWVGSYHNYFIRAQCPGIARTGLVIPDSTMNRRFSRFAGPTSP